MCRPPYPRISGAQGAGDWEGSDCDGVSSYLFGIRGATWFLGVSEWTFGTLLFLGFWNKKLGILGALGLCVTFICTATIIPFMPNGWAASAGGFPAMTEHVAFLMKDIVLFSVSVYLLRQDVLRSSVPAKHMREVSAGI